MLQQYAVIGYAKKKTPIYNDDDGRTAVGTIYRVYTLQNVCPYFIVKRRVISTRAASTATHYCWFVWRAAVGGRRRRRRRRSVWLTSIWSHMLNRCRGRRMPPPPPPYCYCIGRPPSPLWMRSDKRARARPTSSPVSGTHRIE